MLTLENIPWDLIHLASCVDAVPLHEKHIMVLLITIYKPSWTRNNYYHSEKGLDILKLFICESSTICFFMQCSSLITVLGPNSLLTVQFHSEMNSFHDYHYWSVFTCLNYWYQHTVELRYTTIMNNSTLIVATDEKRTVQTSTSQRVRSTPWLVQQSKNQGGSAPLILWLGGNCPPRQPPWFLRQCLE